jgi:hypothetical protein
LYVDLGHSAHRFAVSNGCQGTRRLGKRELPRAPFRPLYACPKCEQSLALEALFW